MNEWLQIIEKIFYDNRKILSNKMYMCFVDEILELMTEKFADHFNQSYEEVEYIAFNIRNEIMKQMNKNEKLDVD